MEWLKVILYIFLLIAFLVFVKLDDIKVKGRKLFSFQHRLLFALAFPILLVMIVLFGSLLLVFILVLILIFGLILLLFILFGKIKLRFIRF